MVCQDIFAYSGIEIQDLATYFENSNSSFCNDDILSSPNIQDSICEVYQNNLHESLSDIQQIIKEYNCIAIDTEFPGIIARPSGEFDSKDDYKYQSLFFNVNVSKIIQLGLTFFNEKGETPEECSTWQFNFQFDLSTDMYNADSIELLSNSGIDFDKHKLYGIDANNFREQIFSSDIFSNLDIKWLGFHCSFDFGYLLKLLTGDELPEDEIEFFELMHMHFPNVYDVKYFLISCGLHGGLQKIADQMKLCRIGLQHQAGSDSILTGLVFFKILEICFEGIIDTRLCGYIFGLGSSYVRDNESNNGDEII